MAPVAMINDSVRYSSSPPFSLNGRRDRSHLFDIGRISPRCPNAFGVLAQLLHELRPQQPLRSPGPVVDIGGGHQLSARLATGDQYRSHVGARTVDRGGIAGRTGTQNQESGDGIRHARKFIRVCIRRTPE